MNFFSNFLEFPISGREGIDRNDNFLYMSFSAFPNLFWLEEKPYSCFIILWIFFFYFFFEFSIMGRVGIDRNDNFYFHSFSAFPPPVLAWRDAVIVFYSFVNFFAIFFLFSISGRVGIDRNDNFYSHSFSAFPDLFWLEENPLQCFLI